MITLHHQDDTHGSHTDDYPYALVVFLDAPPHPPDGGEWIPTTACRWSFTGTATCHPGAASARCC
ncbi:HalD/BesD family halogenase [Streptomyces eurythermus]|uniref:HalD/BesD family halogenase n=1 Tax=Streptomyces eurythermus TaxID=42237 RepID=UPI0033EE40B6